MESNPDFEALIERTLKRAAELRGAFIDQNHKPGTIDSALDLLAEATAQSIAHAGLAAVLMTALGVPKDTAVEAVALSVRSYADMDLESFQKWSADRNRNRN